ncbi:MAG: AMP-binding protein [Rikenellaceae bacterium]
MFDFLVKTNEKDAIFYGDKVYTYNDLLRYSKLHADHCHAKSGQQVERVMFFSKNDPDMIFAIYGALRLSAVAIPVDVMSTKKELAYMIDDARPQVIYTTTENLSFVKECVVSVVMGDSLADKVDAEMTEELKADLEAVGHYNPLIYTADDVDTKDVANVPIIDIPARNEDDVMTIIYTSGTTGSPKGVMLTYANVWYNVNAVSNDVEVYREDTRALMILPLHHVFGLVGTMIIPLYKGSQVYIVEKLTPEVIVETLVKGRITVLLGVPRLYENLAKGIMAKINAGFATKMIYKLASAIGSRAFSKMIFKSVHQKFGGAMEYFVSGGAALPDESAKVFQNLGFYVLEGYGMTECAPMISFTRPGEWHIGYCGQLLPKCEVKIGENEEILVRGANVMKGYYGRPEETDKVIRNGWLHTGDTGVFDEKKGLRITGRIKEIIVTPNGKNINPASIENELTQSSMVMKEAAVILKDDVLQAIVYPDVDAVRRMNSDKTMDELVRAEIEAYNKESIGYKRLLKYHIISQELPKTRLGKIQRFKLNELLEGKIEQKEREDVSDRSECFKAIKAYVDDQTNSYANGDSHFEIDLALDSLGRVSLLAYIQERFGVDVSEEKLGELSTLNLLTAYVEERAESTELEDKSMTWKDILANAKSKLKLPKSGFIHWAMHTSLWSFFSLAYRYRSKGVEKLARGPVIYVANHRSGFDGVLITAKLTWNRVKDVYFFAKDKHFQGGFQKFMAPRNNIILMNVNTNVRESMQQMYEVLSKGKSVVIFPEGTRYKDGITRDFKESFAILSQTLNVPVVPVAIAGSERATFRGIRLPRLGQRISLTFLPQMLSNAGETTMEFATRVRNTIADKLKE